MGRKLDALLGRSQKTAKLKPLLSLALSRVAVLKTQRQAKCSQSRSDVLQLLQLGNPDRALLRVEHVIKEQNMLDVYVMIERYCNLLIERVHLIEQERECPEELREAASSMLYAASRCGDFPELQEIRNILSARFGKEFTARSFELRNNCGVNLTMIQKLSTRMPTRESRMKVLKEIAFDNSIVLNLEDTSGSVEDKKVQTPPHPLAGSSGTAGSAEVLQAFKEETEKDDKYSQKKYKDVAHAAQAAFESAAYAAAAARAAVELSRSETHDSDDQNSPGPKRGKLSSRYESSKTEFGSQNEHITVQNQAEELKRSASSSSSDSGGDTLEVIPPMSSDAIGQPSHSGKVTVFDDSDNEESTMALSPEKVPSRVQSGMKVEPEGSSRRLTLNLEKGPFSLRNRWVRGH
ncbi:putative vacuolar protein sorting-associated protein Ist1 [Rosa chinensis]|uniref:Putative vacuolar protein sorting-associated protein Ist1 n=1 Tax=Rosa chinensis TaxID=74649 RepID=A0A2P6R1T1_ROSCH|nr:uncharacterized protein LOC112197520 [Rosa chinensis]PRQ40392.1 putative vacuolar protein sorting-associated protein Ist1 [Rosa chinensis]